MKNPADDNARKEELVRELAENLSVDQLGIALAFGRNLAMYGVDVTTAWKTATEQSAALQAAYHRGVSDGTLFSSERSAANALRKVKLAKTRMKEQFHDTDNEFDRGVRFCLDILDPIIEGGQRNYD